MTQLRPSDQYRFLQARPTLFLLLALVLAFPGVPLAMDAFGEDAPTLRIPVPALNYRLEVTDTELTRFMVTSASIDGHIYLSGTLGKAKVSVPFDKIDRVHFEPGETGSLFALVTLKTGKQQTLVVKGTTPCYGEADFGNVTIPLKDLRDARFLGRVLDKAPEPGP